VPGNLRGSEITAELFVSLNTIRTHLRSIHAKLGAHPGARAYCRRPSLMIDPAMGEL
jgi:DNA-binding NarL/FixJ family response regulator